MSIKPFKRIYWIVLDGMGIEHARRFLAAGNLPALSRIAREGVLEASRPSSPACQTPTALLALFSGAEPRESGIWGYHMPDPGRPSRTISGFAAPTKPVRTVWDELGDRGSGFSLMNVAFRNDRIWAGASTGLDFAYDGYRSAAKSHVYQVSRHNSRVRLQGIELTLARTNGGVLIRKGMRVRTEVLPGDGQPIALTAHLRVHAFLLDASHVVLAPLSRPMVRGRFRPPSAEEDFVDFNVFRALRGLNRGRDENSKIPVSVEMIPPSLGMRQKESLMVDAIRGTSSRLVIGYFPLVDELNHSCFDLLDAPQPDPRAVELYRAAARLVDGTAARVMAAADRDDLVVLSSDHGASAFRGSLHVNEIFAGCGLVKRKAGGYDFPRSAAYYHPSECGIVLGRAGPPRETVLAGIHRALNLARDKHAVEIGIEEGKTGDPFIAFIYPLFDTYLTARPPLHIGEILSMSRSGGQHISPLAPTPWIQAMLGLWSPRTRSLRTEVDAIPTSNAMLKDFLLGMLEGAPR